MKLTIKPLVVLISVLGGSLASQLACAQTTAASPDIDALVKHINSQTQSLEKQVTQLKHEVKRLKAEQVQSTAKPVVDADAKTDANEAAIANAQNKLSKQPNFEAISPLLRMGASPVIVAPYIGVPSAYDASDLLVYQSTYKLDATMLQRDKLLYKTAADEGITLGDTPTLILSGKIESQIYGSKTYSGPNTSNINLTGAELIAAVHVNKWVNGLITFNYDDGPSSENEQVVTNSSFSIDQAFATIGNLSETPFYMTAGQRTIPFGHYTTYMLSDTLPKNMFKLLERSILLGFDDQKDAIVQPYANTFVFKDDTNAGGGGNNINNFGANLGLRLKANNGVNTDVGVSAVANVADSNGMQSTGLSQFPGFSTSTITTASGSTVNGENLSRKVPGFDAYAGIGNDQYYFNAEYTGATSSFAADNMTFNGHGAKPSAMHTEIVHMFSLGNYPANIAVGYDHTWQALALNMPQQRYITAMNVSFIHNTITTLEFNRWINYAAGDVATGQGSPAIQATGHYENNVALQFGVYF